MITNIVRPVVKILEEISHNSASESGERNANDANLDKVKKFIIL